MVTSASTTATNQVVAAGKGSSTGQTERHPVARSTRRRQATGTANCSSL